MAFGPSESLPISLKMHQGKNNVLHAFSGTVQFGQNFEYVYNKTMFLSLNQLYLWSLQSNTHNNYNYIIKTKWNYYGKYLQKKEKHQAK